MAYSWADEVEQAYQLQLSGGISLFETEGPNNAFTEEKECTVGSINVFEKNAKALNTKETPTLPSLIPDASTIIPPQNSDNAKIIEDLTHQIPSDETVSSPSVDVVTITDIAEVPYPTPQVPLPIENLPSQRPNDAGITGDQALQISFPDENIPLINHDETTINSPDAIIAEVTEDLAIQIPLTDDNVLPPSRDEANIIGIYEIFNFAHQIPLPRENVSSPSFDDTTKTGIDEYLNIALKIPLSDEKDLDNKNIAKEPEPVPSTSRGVEHEPLRIEANPFYPDNAGASCSYPQELMTDVPIMQQNVMEEIANVLPDLPFQLLDAILQDEEKKCAEYRQAREKVSNETLFSECPPPLPRINMVRTDMIGRPRFQPIVPYIWPQETNTEYNDEPYMETNPGYNGVTNMETLGYNYVPDVQNLVYNGVPTMEANIGYNVVPNMEINMGYNNVVNEQTAYYENFQQYQNYEIPNNTQYLENNNIPYPSTYYDDVNATYYPLPENNVQPVDQSMMYQYENIPDGHEPYYPCVDNIEAVYIRQPQYTAPQEVAPWMEAPQRNAGPFDVSYNPELLRQPEYIGPQEVAQQIVPPQRNAGPYDAFYNPGILRQPEYTIPQNVAPQMIAPQRNAGPFDASYNPGIQRQPAYPIPQEVAPQIASHRDVGPYDASYTPGIQRQPDYTVPQEVASRRNSGSYQPSYNPGILRHPGYTAPQEVDPRVAASRRNVGPYDASYNPRLLRQPGYTVPQEVAPRVVSPRVVSPRVVSPRRRPHDPFYNPGLLPVYTQMLNGRMRICSPRRAQQERKQIMEYSRQVYRQSTTAETSLASSISSPRRRRRNTRRSRMDRFTRGSRQVNLRFQHLLDEEEIYLLENMDLRNTPRSITSSLQDAGSQALDLEDYLLIANISVVNHFKCNSCTDLLRSKSPAKKDSQILLSRTEQEDTYDLQSLNKNKNKSQKSTVHTKSIGILTEASITKTIKTQTDILDIKIPFKTIIPTRYKPQRSRSISPQSSPRLSLKFMEYESPEPKLIKKSSKFSQNLQSSPRLTKKFIEYESPEPKFTKLSEEPKPNSNKKTVTFSNPIQTLPEELQPPKPKLLTPKSVRFTDPDTTSEEIAHPIQKSVRFAEPVETHPDENKPSTSQMTQKSVRITNPDIIPQDKYAAPKPQRIRKTVTFSDPTETSSEEEDFPEPILTKRTTPSETLPESVTSVQEETEYCQPHEEVESTIDWSTEIDETTDAVSETLPETCIQPVPSTSRAGMEPVTPQTVTVPQEEDDGIPIVPRRKNWQPGEPADDTYAAVVGVGTDTSPESLQLKRTESLKRMVEVHTVEVNIPPSNTRIPTSYADAASRSVARKPPSTRQSTIRQSRPIAPVRSSSTNWVVLELTLSQRLMPNSLQYNFQCYMARGMHFKSLGRQIVLLIFRNERDAKEVLEGPCVLGTIVPIAAASEKSREVASRYCNTIGRRHNTPSRYYHSGYKS